MRSTRISALVLTLVLAAGCAGGSSSGGGSNGPDDPSSPITLSGPEERVATTDGHLVIHFTRQGADATDDEFVRWGREAMELGWRELVDRLGWRSPPPDNGSGGDDRYDVFLLSFYASHLGQTARGYTHETGNGTSYIVINTDIRPGTDPSRHPLNPIYSETFVRSVFAHELVHACQVAYGDRSVDGPDGSFFAENSASYHQADMFGLFESESPKDILIVQALLLTRFAEPRLSLHNGEMERAYAPVWSKYLVDSRGGDRTILRRVYEEQAADSSSGVFGAMNRVLQSTGGDLQTDYQIYAEWNYKAGPYADGTGYEDADQFSTVFGSVNVTFEEGAPPAERSSGASSPSSLGSNYIRFRPDPASPDGVFRFTGQIGVRWGVTLLARDPSTGVYEVTREFVGPLQTETSIAVRDWNEKDDLVAVVSNLNVTTYPDESAGRYRYRIEAANG